MSLEGYPLMEGGQYPSEGYGQGGYAGSSEYGGGVGPFEEFSTEDNQLLMSVLSSTPVPEQYNLAYPTSVPGSMQMWDGNHAYTPQMGSFGFFASPQTSPHLSHTMAGARGPPVMHPNMSGAMHGAMSSSQTHMAGNQPNTGFGTGTAPNPFAMRHEGQHHASMKQEGVVPVFTPNSAPYNTSATQHLPSAYSATLMAAPHGPLPVQQRLSAGPGTPPVAHKHAPRNGSGAATNAANQNQMAASSGMTSGVVHPQAQHSASSTLASGAQTGPGGHYLRSTATTASHSVGAAAGASSARDGPHSSRDAHAHSNDGSASPPSYEDDSPPSSAHSTDRNGQSHSARGAHSAQHAAQVKDEPTSADEFDEETGPRNRRRESQNRASRNYRQRKKAYIKEMEAKLDALKLEVEVLRGENQKQRRLLSQHGDKPAPLIRSYSSELADEETEIEKLVSRLNEKTADPATPEEDLRILLAELHEHMGKRQQILNKEALQLVNPKLQERFARLEATPQHQLDEQMETWLQHVAQFVSADQIQKLAELKSKHFATRAAIWEERAAINNDIKEFYQEKIASDRFNTPGRLDQIHISTLTQKLEALKRNLTKEDELNAGSVGELSSILTPYQEAIITVKHYSHYKDKLSATQMLGNVWSILSKQDK